MRRFLLVALVTFTPAALAQSIEPGQWEFNSTTSARGLGIPQSATITRCVKPEEAANPESWISRQSARNDCRFTPTERSAGTLKWDMECPKSNMRGHGTATFTAKSMQSEMQLSTELQGQRLDVTTRLTGRRLGPCTS